MTADTQPPLRKQFRLSRYKPNESAKNRQSAIVRPNGGSKQTRPFDPAELTRRLETYQREEKLARARREIAELETREALSPHDRNDSGHDDKTETASLDVEEQIAVVVVGPVEGTKSQRPASVKQQSRPRHERKVSSSRLRRNAPGTYFPRFAAKQFSATTTPLQTTAPKSSRKADEPRAKTSPDASSPRPRDIFEGTPMPKTIEREPASAPDLATIRDRRRSAMLYSETSLTIGPRTARPRPLSTALENLNIQDEADSNPYMPFSPRHHDSSDAEKYKHTDPSPTHSQPRPTISAHDRHDWSQASQCGDSARQSLHLHSIWRKDQGASDTKQSQPRPHDAKQRGTSQGDLPDNQTMIADAVKLVNKDRKRKGSLLSFLKRHH